MKIVIIASGYNEDVEFLKKEVAKADCIICADGGSNHAHTAGIIPDYVIGDMDSIDKEVLIEYKKNKSVNVVEEADQNSTDVQKALQLSKSLNADEIILLCAIGSRIDHTLGNIMYMNKKIQIVNPNNIIHFVDDSIELSGQPGDTVSVIPLSDVEGLTYTGLKWNPKQEDNKFGWVGTCNEMISEQATVSITKGKLLVIEARD